MPEVYTDKQLVDIVMFAGESAEIEGEVSEVDAGVDVAFNFLPDEDDPISPTESTVISIKELRPFRMEWTDADPEDMMFFIGAVQVETSTFEVGERCYGLLRNDGSAKVVNTAESYV